MKKLIVILNLLLVSATELYAQANNEYAIYDTIVKMHGTAKPLRYTSLRTFDEFNFKDTKDYEWDIKDTLNSDWKQFFNSIDISKIKPGQLDTSFLLKHPLASKSDRKMEFSPIVISADGIKAICGVSLQGGGGILYLFEKKNDKWTFRKKYIVSMQ